MSIEDQRMFGHIRVSKVGQYAKAALDPVLQIPNEILHRLPSTPGSDYFRPHDDFTYAWVPSQTKGKTSTSASPPPRRLHWVHKDVCGSTDREFFSPQLAVDFDSRRESAWFMAGQKRGDSWSTLWEVDLVTGAARALEYVGWPTGEVPPRTVRMLDDGVAILEAGHIRLATKSGDRLTVLGELEMEAIDVLALNSRILLVLDSTLTVLGANGPTLRQLAEIPIRPRATPRVFADGTVHVYTQSGSYLLEGLDEAWNACFAEPASLEQFPPVAMRPRP